MASHAGRHTPTFGQPSCLQHPSQPRWPPCHARTCLGEALGLLKWEWT